MAISTKMSVTGASSYKKSMRDCRNAVKSLDDELKLAEAEYKENGNAQEYMRRKSVLLKQAITQQKNAVNTAKAAMEQAAQQYGANSEQCLSWKNQLTQAKIKLATLKTKLNQTNNDMSNLSKETGEAESGLEDMGKQADTAGDKLSGIKDKFDIAVITGGLDTITEKMAGVARKAGQMAKAIWDATAGAGQQADEILTTSTQTGIDTTTLQQWRYASQFVDTEVDSIINARKRVLAGMTSKDGINIGGIQIATKDAAGQMRDWQDVFWDSVDALGQMTNETERDAAALDLFGRGYAEMLPLITAGREAWEEYASRAQVLTPEQLESLGALDDTMNDMNASLEGTKLQVLTALAPVIQTIAEAVASVTSALSDYLKTEEGQQMLANLSESLGGIMETLFSPEAVQNTVSAITGALESVNNFLDWLINNKDTAIGVVEGLAMAFGGMKISSDVLKFMNWLDSSKSLLGKLFGGGTGGSAGGTVAAKAAEKGMGILPGLGLGAGALVTAAATNAFIFGGTNLMDDLTMGKVRAGRQATADTTMAAVEAAGDSLAADAKAAAEAFSHMADTYNMNEGGGIFSAARRVTANDQRLGLMEMAAASVNGGFDLSKIINPQAMKDLQWLVEWTVLNDKANDALMGKGDITDAELARWEEMQASGKLMGDQEVHDLYDTIYNEMATYLQTAAGLPAQARADGANTSIGLGDGIYDQSSYAYQAATDLANGVANRISGTLAIQSPSRVMMALGGYTAEGFALGIQGSLADIRSAADGMAAAAITGTAYAPRPAAGATGAAFNAEAFGAALRSALSGVAVNMSGERVGELVSDTVDSEIGRAAYNARYNV